MKYMMISATLALSILSHAMEPEKIQLTRGFLIAIEGIDGSGKSTLARHLNDALQQKYTHVKLTKEPGDTEVGKKIREIVQTQTTPLDPTAEYLLFAADRAEHFSKMIIPHLNKNYIVISDRLADSSLAYQGYGRGLDKDKIKLINAWAMHDRQPDLTIFVKIPVETALKRIQKRNEDPSVFEKESFLKDVAVGFEIIYSHYLNSKQVTGSPRSLEYYEQERKKAQTTTLRSSLKKLNLTNLDPVEFKKIHAEDVKLITVDGTQPEKEIADSTIAVVNAWIAQNNH